MRILYIADNRNRHNWGCRATSAALSEMISKEHKIVGRISGRFTMSKEPVYVPLWNGKLNSLIYKNEVTYALSKQIIKKMPHSINSSFDFLSDDFDKSIELIKQFSQVNAEYKEINLDLYSYDAIVINGEGTMIMTSPWRRDTLYYLLFTYWAKKRGKKVFFVNAMFSDCPKTGRNEKTISLMKNILSKCDMIGVRDPLSYRYAKETIGLEDCEYIPDALFSWVKYYHQENIIKNIRDILPYGCESDKALSGSDISADGYICVSGSSAAAWNQRVACTAYTRFVKELKKKTNCPIFLVQVCSGDAFLEKVARMTDTYFVPVQVPIISGLNLLAHAKLYISGRYHPSIMASLGGTPCIFLGANSHKNMGLQEMLEYDMPKEYHACPSEEDIEGICRDAQELMNDVKRRKKIKEVCAQRADEAGRIIEQIK